MRHTSVGIGLAILSGLAVCAASAGTGTRISEAFHYPAGALPPGWAAVRRGDGALAEIGAAGVRGSTWPGHSLNLERRSGAASNAAVFYAGSRGAVREGRMTDLSATVVVTLRRLGNSSGSGLVLRAQRPAYNGFRGYFVAVGGGGSDRGFGIFWDPETHVFAAGDALAFAPVPELRAGVEYLLRVDAVGTVIEASLWTLDAAGNAAASLGIVRIETEDQPSPGYVGLRGANGNSGPIGAGFRDLHVESMP